MPSSHRTYEVFLGTPVEAELGVTLLGTGSAGDPSARRRLVHPNPALPPITYAVNPARSLNLDNDVVAAPITGLVQTLASTRLVRFDRNLEDAVVAEVWPGSDRSAAMPTSFLRLLLEYWLNPPAFDPLSPSYVRWEPRDRNANAYDVELVRITVGGQDGLDVGDVREPGGRHDPNLAATIEAALDDLDEEPTGLVDRPVAMLLRVVAKVDT